MATAVKHISSGTQFDTELRNAGTKAVIVDFTASWCGPCQRIKPKFIELSNTTPSVVFLSVDVDEVADVAQKYGIEAMPTFKIFKNGTEVEMMRGANEAGLTNVINKYK